MASIQIHWVIFSLFIVEIIGEDITILPLHAYTCKDFEPIIEWGVNVRNINDDGVKVLDLNIEFYEDFTEKWMFDLKIDKWNNGVWDENFYNAYGNACQIVDQYVSRVWKNLRKDMEPPIPGICSIKVGRYKVTDFSISRTDYDIPVTFLGRYRVTGKVYDPDDNEMICQVVELETNKN